MTSLPQPRKQPKQARSQHMVETILEATARILAERGYAGTNTNVVAELAGVSVGSVYQYFPHKDALVTALHERHAEQMGQVIDEVLSARHPRSLKGHIEALVHALMAAHQVSPELHRVLEKEFPFFDAPKSQSSADKTISLRIRSLLDAHRQEVAPRNLDLATWVVLQMLESMVHAAVIEAAIQFKPGEIETAIVDAVLGYLVFAR